MMRLLPSRFFGGMVLLSLFVAPPTAVIGATDGSEGEIVSLPAFVVEGMGDVPLHWYHAEALGMEILSCRSESETKDYISSVCAQARLYAWTLPAEIRPSVGRPLVVILDNRPFTQMKLPLQSMGRKLPHNGVVVGGSVSDWDFASSYERYWPTAPVNGAFLVGGAREALFTQQPGWDHLERLVGRAAMNIAAVDNTTLEIQQPMLSLTESKLPLPSLGVLYTKSTPFTENQRVASVNEASIWFGRWALFADEGQHREAFWNYARAIAVRPRLDDEFARHYFGLGLAELDQRVGAFRKNSQKKSLVLLKLPSAAPAAAVNLRDATEEEIACALVQWTLVTWRHNSVLRVPLRQAAARAIARFRKTKPETPHLVALRGLIELLNGEVPEARADLESVANAPDLNPGARFELAKLRYTEAVEHPASGNQLDPAQVASILAPLAPFRAQPPANSDVFALILQTWLRAKEKPSPDELARFVSSARRFPRDDQLLFQAALLCSEQGLPQEANSLAATGLEASKTDEVRQSFAALSARLAKGGSSGVRP